MEQEGSRRIAVLMTVHNRRETTLACLRRLDGMTFDRMGFRMEVFLTDDGSTDGTAEAVRLEFPEVHIIQGDGQLYWNRGMYAAWQEAAKGDYDFYWWVNDDTFVFEDTLYRMLACSAAHADAAIIVGCTCASDAPDHITYGGVNDWKVVKDVKESYRCESFNGNLVLIPNAVYSVLGMNDPYYKHAIGDGDYGLRATEAGIGIWTVPGPCGICDLHERPTVWMDPEQPLGKRWKNFFSPLGNNPFEFFHFRKKHYGLFPALATLCSNFLHFLLPGLWLKAGDRHGKG